MIDSLEDLSEALTRVRIARHLTQDQLAEKLEVIPQATQKQETNTCQHASCVSILKVANTPGIKMKGGAE
jgi:DNA-binding XRE family transcriptional regulator